MRRFFALLALLALSADALVLRGALLCQRGQVEASAARVVTPAQSIPGMAHHHHAADQSPAPSAPKPAHDMQGCQFMVACTPAVRPAPPITAVVRGPTPDAAPIRAVMAAPSSRADAPEPPPPRAAI